MKQKNNSAISITGYITKTKLKEHHGNIKQDQHYTDSNFSDIFILWDKIFGTYKYKPVEQINFGLKEFEEEKKQTFWYQMKGPFIKVKRISSDELTIVAKPAE